VFRILINGLCPQAKQIRDFCAFNVNKQLRLRFSRMFTAANSIRCHLYVSGRKAECSEGSFRCIWPMEFIVAAILLFCSILVFSLVGFT
jgi:hypothetical protein